MKVAVVFAELVVLPVVGASSIDIIKEVSTDKFARKIA